MIFFNCSPPNPFYDPQKLHHTPTGFKNIYIQHKKTWFDILKWRVTRNFSLNRNDPIPDFKISQMGHEFLHDPTKDSVNWIGHSTWLIRVKGKVILTDPHFTERASPVSFAGPKRITAPGLTIDQLPAVDVVVISHDHYDHMDEKSLMRLHAHPSLKDAVFVTPLNYKDWFSKRRIRNCHELDWWESVDVHGVSIRAVPVQHWCKRTLVDTNRRLWAGYAIQVEGRDIFFSGDAAMSPHFQEIAKEFSRGFDLSLLPIGAYEPRWFMKPSHMNPDEAVQVHQIVKSKLSLGGHWGTFILSDEPVSEPPEKLAEAIARHHLRAQDFRVLRHGESILF